jgi:DNA gyrase subunit A
MRDLQQVRRGTDGPSGGGEGGAPGAASPGDPGDTGQNGGGGNGTGEGTTLTPDNPGQILDLKIERELQDSYLTYAMSTIMDRALPDVRDGLKPSQRRILVAMNDLRLAPGKKHLKCSKICGDTSGNYHPHGDAVIYPTLVILGQKWRTRQPLIDPQGNFGSVKPDPPAAMRYTEARLTHAAMDMLADIGLDTVDFQPNYDDRMTEPTVLPGKFPNLLVNGGVGIAVGMATSMAPNNPVEVLDSIVRFIDNPAITLPELMQDVKDESGNMVRRGIQGPDFPTGGTILGRRGIVEAYGTGRGKVTVRGTVHTEPVRDSKDRQQLVIDELPFNCSIDSIIDDIGQAIEAKKITDINEGRNESSSKAPVRIVIELKRGADAAVVEKQLYEFTSLQQNFSVQNIALVNRQPRTLSLIEMIRCYIDHRAEVIRRRTAHLLHEARKRAHLLEGLILAVCEIDEVIRLIRASKTRAEAIEKLIERRFQIPEGHPAAASIPARLLSVARAASLSPEGGVALTRVQAESIGAMRLIQLVGLEVERLVAEYRAVAEEIEGFERILADHALVLGLIKADCNAMRARYNTPRLTQVQEAEGEDLNMAALIAEVECAVTVSHQGYAKRVPLDTYKQQGRGGKGIIAGSAKDDDHIEHLLVASSHDDLLCFTNLGRVYKIKVFELPELSRQSKGRPLINLMEFKGGEKPIAFLAVKNFEEGSHYLTTVSTGGIVKRTPLKDYRNVHKGGLIAVDIREGDTLLDVVLTSGSDDLLLATAGGMAIRFPEDDVRVMGRQAGGVKGIDLEEGDSIVGAVRVPMQPDADGDPVTVNPELTLLTITVNGYGKRTPIDEYRVQPEGAKFRSQSRGGKGRTDIKTQGRNGRSVAAIGVVDADDVVVATKDGQLVRMSASTINTIGRGTQGVRVVKLNEGDEVTAVSRVDSDRADAPPGLTDSVPDSPKDTAENTDAGPAAPGGADEPPASDVSGLE